MLPKMPVDRELMREIRELDEFDLKVMLSGSHEAERLPLQVGGTQRWTFPIPLRPRPGSRGVMPNRFAIHAIWR